MKLVYLDTEVSELYLGKVCQLSYIIEDKERITAKNFYFEVDYLEPEVESVHGLTVEKLKVLSNGVKFDDIKYEILKDFDGALLIGHNVHFNISKINLELDSIRLHNESFCTMKYFANIVKLPGYCESYKWPSITELSDFLEIDEKGVIEKCKDLFSNDLYMEYDARFKAVAAYLFYKKGLENELIPKSEENSENYFNRRIQSKDLKNTFARFTTEYKCIDNKILHHCINKYFRSAEDICEVCLREMKFKYNGLTYHAKINFSSGVSITSDLHRDNDILKTENYTITSIELQEVINGCLNYIEQLFLFRNLCCWLSARNKKVYYELPDDLAFILNNITFRNKVKELGLIFYDSLLGWRLHKDWNNILEDEFQKYIKERENKKDE